MLKGKIPISYAIIYLKEEDRERFCKILPHGYFVVKEGESIPTLTYSTIKYKMGYLSSEDSTKQFLSFSEEIYYRGIAIVTSDFSKQGRRRIEDIVRILKENRGYERVPAYYVLEGEKLDLIEVTLS